jgi:hypothetical protein
MGTFLALERMIARPWGFAAAARREVVLLVCLWLAACQEQYRVGDHVWVEWEGREYPAYVLEITSKSRLRVHFEGYDTRWDRDVTLDEVRGRVKGPVKHPPPPEKVARAMGLRPKPSASAGAVSPYRPGDRVRVRWRGSVYAGTVQAVLAADRFLIHYDGYGSEWDEPVAMERIVGRR